MFVLRCCLVLLLGLLSQFAQAEETRKEILLPQASVETLDRLKTKLAENAGRDAVIQCEAREVNKTFMIEKWGEAIFEFVGPKNLNATITPPTRKEFREWLKKYESNLGRGYSLKEMSEREYFFPIERNPGVEKPAVKKLEPIDEVKSPSFMAFLLGLVLPINVYSEDVFFNGFEQGYQNHKAACLLMTYAEVGQRFGSNTLYQKEDYLIWELTPKDENISDQILVMLDPESVQPLRIRIWDPGRTSYNEYKIINYELK